MSKHHTTVSADEAVAMFDLNLKNRAFAALLAWLVPGLGHLYQGRTAKGLLFMLCIVSTFAFGYYVGDGRVVYASTERFASAPNDAAPGGGLGRRRRGGRLMTLLGAHWKFAFQAGIGGVAIPAVIERQRALAGKPPLFGEALRPPRHASLGPPEPFQDDSGNPTQQPDELAVWQYQGGFRHELGVVYTLVAGLLNILVVYDAYSGPLIVRQTKPDGDDQPGGDKPGDNQPAGKKPDNDPPAAS